jgi:uroporphyrinogen decarboxylase
MDILAVKRHYGRDLCLNGGISTQLTLPRGTAQAVRDEVEACLYLLGKGGGYVISPAKAIMADVPLENAATLIDVMLRQPGTNAPRYTRVGVDDAGALQRVYREFHPNSS